MSKKIIVAALVAALAGTTALAQEHRGPAQGRDHRGQHHGKERAQPDRAARSEGGRGRTEDFNAGYDGAGPNHDLRRGELLPRRYLTHQYVVDNWRLHHLSRPPQGHAWVQTGADYVLIDTSNGAIAQVATGR
jgi:Ni/Co efflux regulator RcnB